MATLAGNLDVLRHEVWAAWPGVPVGWIGDAAHRAEGAASDHNPDQRGIVHAVDVMVTGSRAQSVVRAAVGRDDVHYVIYNRTIWTAERDWRPHAYAGNNPHIDHVHVSGRYGTQYEQVLTRWGIAAAPAPRPGPTPAPRPTPNPGAGHRVLRITQPPMRGDDIRFAQRFIGAAHCGTADGIYGPHTAAGVRWYQHMRGLSVDGVVGPQTWRSMTGH